MNKPLIHIFHTPKHGYLFDANTNAIVQLEDSVLNAVQAGTHEDEDKPKAAEWNELVSRGYLSARRDFEMLHPMDETLEYDLDRRLRTMALQVTQNCNLRCKYCIYSGSYANRVHSNKRMNREVAFRAIDFFINHSVDSPAINLGFYGGEPLLEIKLIKSCITYAKKKAAGKTITFNLTTNATLFDLETIRYLSDNDVRMTISLDGPEQTHNQNRVFAVNGCGTFETIIDNLELIKEHFPAYLSKISFNAVVDPSQDFNCVNDFFCSYETIKDMFTSSSLINDTYSKNEVPITPEYSKSMNYEIFKLFLWRLGRLEQKHVSKFVMPYDAQLTSGIHNRIKVSSARFTKDHPSGPCIPGVQRLFVDVDGNLYPCERVSETSEIMRIGNITDGFDVEKARKILNIGQLTEKQCRSCWAFRFCTQCAATADGIHELSSALRLQNCSRIRSSTEAMFRSYCVLRELGYDFEDSPEEAHL